MSSSSDPAPGSQPAPPKDRSSRFNEGIETIGRAVWFLFSIILYVLGMIFLTIGQGLIRLSGWSARKEPDPTDPERPKEN